MNMWWSGGGVTGIWGLKESGPGIGAAIMTGL